MRRQPDPKRIGVFVVGAVTIMVAAVLIFGPGRFFADKDSYVLYFDGSVKGLSVGAPVLLKGVEIGAVKDIEVHLNTEDLSIRTPVFIEVEPDKLSEINGDARLGPGLEDHHTRKLVDLLVQGGLRAKLELESIVTGRLVIAFDFHPGTPVHLIGLEKEHPELPTIPSGMEQLARSVEELPVQELLSKAVSAVEGIDRLVNSPELFASISSLNKTLNDSGKLARNLDRRITPLASSLEETIRNTMKLVKNVDGKVMQVTSGLESTLRSADAAAVQIEKTFGAIEDVVGENGALIYQLVDTLGEISGTARSLRVLADYLEQHPESVLFGKSGS